MAFRRIAAAALSQAALFGCGAGVLAAWSAHFYAGGVVLLLAALWIGAASAWQGRLRPATPPERRRRDDLARDDVGSRFLASLLDQTPAPLLTLNAEGVVQARNRAARALLRTDDRVLDPPPALLDALEAGTGGERLTLAHGTLAHGTLAHGTLAQGEGASPHTYAVALGDVLSAAGPMRLAVLLDIEPEVRAAEAAALRELMQVLSHEIMNALTPVASLADTAVELIASPEPLAHAQAAEAVAILARRARALARFAEDYRTLARLPAPSKRLVNLDELLGEVERLAQSRWSRQGMRVTAIGSARSIQAQLDPDQIIQAMLHLVANAAEAAQTQDDPSLTIALSVQNGRPLIEVRDNGAGVAIDVRERIFQPFFTTKPHGSGIGLSLARQIARAHGGDLRLTSAPHAHGATFELGL